MATTSTRWALLYRCVPSDDDQGRTLDHRLALLCGSERNGVRYVVKSELRRKCDSSGVAEIRARTYPCRMRESWLNYSVSRRSGGCLVLWSVQISIPSTIGLDNT